MSFINTTKKSLCVFLKIIFSYTKLYIIWIFIHYVSSKLYTYYCTPDSVVGFVKSSFMVITPQCQALDFTQRKIKRYII